ncbi:MAG: spondin domain-containing protein [Pseudomonadota bacterium]
MKTKKTTLSIALTAVMMGMLAHTAGAQDTDDDDGELSLPSIIINVTNSAPSRGAAQTPFWVGIHDGSFDTYDRNVPLGAAGLVPSPAVERLAEDGATGPITEAFEDLLPGAPQATMFGPTGPFAPGDRSAITLQVEPSIDRYFSYASMVIPSNDAFIANGNPLAHELFNEEGRFVGSSFVVAGSEVLDAGTEVNDEIAGNTAFLGQAAPDTGVTESMGVILHEGFLSGLAFPDGVLSHPIFGMADFLASTYRAAEFSFRFVDLARETLFSSRLTPGQEVTAVPVQSRGGGLATLTSYNAQELDVFIAQGRLSGPVVMAHLHLGQEGTNGPVVANLTDAINGEIIDTVIDGSAVVGPLAEGDDPFLNLLNEMAAGNIYINLHTEANPGGEIRGQVRLRRN